MSADRSIAIVGMAGRFPGAPTLDAFWRNLCDGVESVSFFTQDELRAAGVPPEQIADPDYVPAAAVIDDIDQFDAQLFDISPAEAEQLDPQQRIFLEIAWEALEDAGHDPQRFDGLIGVYAGAAMNTYALNHLIDRGGIVHATDLYEVMLGNDKDFLASRAAYKLNLRGPSVTVQTACSTSLVAVHMACQSLLGGECDVALAGGVSLMVPQRAGYLYQPGMVLSPDGHCRPFDARAQGIVGGNGAGVVVLRRLDDALAAGDSIRAVIRGSAVNNDGGNRAGFTAPGIDGQAAVIAEAQAVAGIEPASIGYVETHGTATPVGDPIEVAALTRVFGARPGLCFLGSVKSNIGHLNTAAGIAGLIKTVLALQHARIPPSLHFTEPNPRIDFAVGPFRVAAELTDWPAAPRRAGVSSFGIGGVNAHIVLEEAPAVSNAAEERECWRVLPLSARSAGALDRMAARLAAHLDAAPETDLGHVAFTLASGRRVLEHRRAALVSSRADAIRVLEGAAPDRISEGLGPAGRRSVAFLLSGQGSQHIGMGRELYETQPAFRDTLDRCAEILAQPAGFDLREVLYPHRAGAEAEARLTQTEVAQPALFAICYALAEFWRSAGVKPVAMLGHSIGEYVAACLAGVFSLEDALGLVTTRGRLMQRMPPGAMLSVPLGEHELADRLNGLSLAAVNGSSQCVVSGAAAVVAAFSQRLQEDGIDTIPLRTSHAFHSHLADGILDEFRTAVGAVRLMPPRMPFLSNVSGTWITEAQATSADYWTRHLRGTVRFADGLGELLREPARVLIEVGPGRGLAAMARQHPAWQASHLAVGSLGPRHGTHEPSGNSRQEPPTVLRSMALLWAAGVTLDCSEPSAGRRPRRVPLPTYPFERRSFWPTPRIQTGRLETALDALPSEPSSICEMQVGEQGHAGGRLDIDRWFYACTWERGLPEPQVARHTPECWFLFCDPAGHSAALAGELAARGQSVVRVQPGDQFACDGSDYTLHPADPAGYEALANIIAATPQPVRIVHNWGFDSLLHLGRALGRIEGGVQICIVTSCAWPVTGTERPRPLEALSAGPAMVLPQEYPHLVCRQIDCDQSVSTSALAVELLRADAPTIVALRGPYRWVRAYRPVTLAKQAPLPEQGIWLITGGLGGVGLALAEHLARTSRARLVLTRRRPWLQRDSDAAPIAAALRELEAVGAEVMVAAADVTDRAAMQAVVDRARARFGRIYGVIHAAGVVRPEPIERKTAEAAAQAMAAKVRGAEVLDAVFADAPPDVMVLCSSLASVLGGIGLVDYVAANAFLDAFAARRALERPGLTISIGWDGWHDLGMAADLSEAEQRRRALAMLGSGITAAEGGEALHRALGAGLPQVLVSVGNLETRMARGGAERLTADGSNIEIATLVGEAASSVHPRPALATAYTAPRSPIEETLSATVAAVLGIERVGVFDNFFDLGMDSFRIIQVHGRLRRQLAGAASVGGGPLSVADMFEYHNVAELAHRLSRGDTTPRRDDGLAERARRQQQAMEEDRRQRDRRLVRNV
jgi:acyl transferase domain-containing protein